MTCPSIFLAHGSPVLVDDAIWMAELAQWAGDMPRPKSILVLSAHWLSDEEDGLTIGATRTVPLTYDFYGFPRRYYELTYTAPGAPISRSASGSCSTRAGEGGASKRSRSAGSTTAPTSRCSRCTRAPTSPCYRFRSRPCTPQR